MESLFPTRGCIMRVTQGGGNDHGSFYALQPPIGGKASSPVLLLGAEVSADDVLLPKSTLDDFQVIYSFGKGFGVAQIHGVVLLGNTKEGNGAGLAAVVSYFRAHRTSTSKKPIKLSMPGGIAYNIFLSGLAIGQVDPNFNVQAFVLGGIPLENNLGKGKGGGGLTTGTL